MSYLDRLKKLPRRQDEYLQNPQNPWEGGFVGSEGTEHALFTRIHAMASRWNYRPDELAEALTLAGKDPSGWRRLVEHDEGLA